MIALKSGIDFIEPARKQKKSLKSYKNKISRRKSQKNATFFEVTGPNHRKYISRIYDYTNGKAKSHDSFKVRLKTHRDNNTFSSKFIRAPLRS